MTTSNPAPSSCLVNNGVKRKRSIVEVPLPLETDEFVRVGDYGDRMSESMKSICSSAAQTYFAFASEPEDIVIHLAKRRNMVVIPLLNSTPRCCRHLGKGLVPHDLLVTLELSSRSLTLLHGPTWTRSSFCWISGCSKLPTNINTFTCDEHSESFNPKEVINFSAPLGEQFCPVTLHPSSDVLSLSHDPEPLIRALMETGLKELMRKLNCRAGFKKPFSNEDYLTKPLAKLTDMVALKSYLLSRPYIHRYITISYSPHIDRIIVRVGDDGPWGLLCGAPSCKTLCLSKSSLFCVSHHSYDIFLKRDGLLKVVIDMLCRESGLEDISSLLQSTDSLTKLMSFFASGNKLSFTSGNSKLLIYSSALDNRPVLNIRRATSASSSYITQLCLNRNCFQFFPAASPRCSLCYPPSRYKVRIYRNGSQYYILQAIMVPNRHENEGFDICFDTRKVLDSTAWSVYKEFKGYWNKEEGNSLALASALALLIESVQSSTPIQLMSRQLRIGSQTFHFLHWLLARANLKLLVTDATPEGFHLPDPPWFLNRDSDTRKPKEEVIYEAVSHSLKLLYVGLNRCHGTNVLSDSHNSPTDTTMMTKLRLGEATANRVIASIINPGLRTGSLAHTAHCEQSETVHILSRLIDQFLLKTTGLALVNANCSNMCVSEPRAFLAHLIDSCLFHFKKTFTWELDDIDEGTGTTFKPYLLDDAIRDIF